MSTPASLLVLDGPNCLMRCVKAAEAHVDLSSSDGIVTAPVFMAINMLSKYVRRYPTDKVVVAWDKGHTKRDEIYAGYKENRAHHDPTLEEVKTGAFGMMKEFLSLAGIHHVEILGEEADDIIAGYWRKPWLTLTIVSGDKDLLQLCTMEDRQVRPQPGAKSTPEIEEWYSDRVERELGCTPHDLPLVMALTGDSGDDVPGIRGFGIKTAVKHLQRAGWDLGRLLDNPPPVLEKTEGYREIVERNLKLVDLRHNLELAERLPEPPNFRPTTMDSPTWAELINWCNQYDMETVKNRLIKGTLWRDSGEV